MIGLISVSIASFGADQSILGTSLLVKAGDSATTRRVVVKAREIRSDNTLVGNPVANGATLTINANGTIVTAQTFALPSGTSALTAKPFWSGDPLRGFKYRDRQGENGAAKAVQIKRTESGVFSLKASIDARNATVDIVPPNPGVSGCATLALGSGDSYVVRFAEGVITNDGGAAFKVSKPTQDGPCPSPPRCGDGIIDQPNEECDGNDAAACPGLSRTSPGVCRSDCTCERSACCAGLDVPCTFAPNACGPYWSGYEQVAVQCVQDFDLGGNCTLGPCGGVEQRIVCHHSNACSHYCSMSLWDIGSHDNSLFIEGCAPACLYY